MFYLNSFWKTILQNPFKGVFFSFFTISLFFGILSKKQIDQKIFDKITMSGQESFFYALLDDKENQARIARKLRALPGVKKVDILTSHSVNAKAAEVIKSVGLGLSSELMNLDYSGLKVVFLSKISTRSIQLIRDYLNRLVGKKHITLGGIKTPRQSQKKLSGILNYVKSWGSILSLLSFFLLWLVSFTQFREALSKNAYLVESFQRRDKVAIKMLIVGLLSFSFIAIIFHLTFFGIPSFVNLSLILGIAMLAIGIQSKVFRWVA
jgi:hypothetical protein